MFEKPRGVWFRYELCPDCGKPFPRCTCPKDAARKALDTASQFDFISGVAGLAGVPSGCLLILFLLAFAVLALYVANA